MIELDEFAAHQALIKVIGVGGGGGNAINTMVEAHIQEVEFLAANTDRQSLKNNLAPLKIPLGQSLTKGLGAGAHPPHARRWQRSGGGGVHDWRVRGRDHPPRRATGADASRQRGHLRGVRPYHG